MDFQRLQLMQNSFYKKEAQFSWVNHCFCHQDLSCQV